MHKSHSAKSQQRSKTRQNVTKSTTSQQHIKKCGITTKPKKTKKILKKISPTISTTPLTLTPMFHFSTTLPNSSNTNSTTQVQQTTPNHGHGGEEEEEPELEIITKSPTPQPQQPRSNPLQHSHKTAPAAIISPSTTAAAKKNNKTIFKTNQALPAETIPPEGIVIFEHKARPWLQVIPPVTTIAAIGTVILDIGGGIATQWSSPELLTLLACTTGSVGFASWKAYDFTQRHVHLVRLMQDNIINFETSGFFGFKRFVSYPANFVYPLMVDPQHGMFGFKIKFLPLIQDMELKPGQLQTYDSGLVIAPDANLKKGDILTCWNHLLSGSQSFAEKDTNESKRRVTHMV